MPVIRFGEPQKPNLIGKFFNAPFPENLEMLHSLYDFAATYAKTLSFKSNEYFILHQTNTKHKNWWEVINEKGEMGFIPSNYVEKVNVSPMFYIQFLDSCIENLIKSGESTGYVIDNNELIMRLKEIKRKVEMLPEVSRNSIGSSEDEMPPLLFRNSDGQLETMSSLGKFALHAFYKK